MKIRKELIDEVAKSARTFWDKKLSPGSDSGDTSLLDRETGLVYILPRPSERQPIKNWSVIGPGDVAVIDMDGQIIGDPENLPTVESPMHLSIYKARPDVNAIVHSHGKWSQIFAGVRKDIPVFVEDSFLACGGNIKCAEFAREGTEQLAINFIKALGRFSKAALLAAHGAACVGRNMDEAFFVAEMVELAAQQALFARLIGEPVPFTIDNIYDPAASKSGGALPIRAMGMNVPQELIEKKDLD
jgi:L-fuculose-phosphate aldolase